MSIIEELHQQVPLFAWPVQFCIGITVTTYVLSILTGNVSQVDRLWTFLPTIYAAYWALVPLWPRVPQVFPLPYAPETVHKSFLDTFSPRALLMLTLIVIWMIRLTYNAWHRGIFRFNEEDYRWPILRKKMPPWVFQVLNLMFISIIQNILLLAIAAPTKIAISQPHTSLGITDYVLGTLGFLAILIEFIADDQQQAYQTFKRSGKLDRNNRFWTRIAWTKQDAKRGFVTRGLWAWSRHPNFLCEQSFWVIINLIPLLCADGPWGQETPRSLRSLAPLLPSLSLCALFAASTDFTESISLSKYPAAYRAYQQRVGRFLPFSTLGQGILLSARGKKQEVDEIVYGREAAKVE